MTTLIGTNNKNLTNKKTLWYLVRWARLDEERGAVSEDLKTFLGRMQDVAEKIHLMEETNKDVNRLQQKIRSAASQQHIEKDKERLDELQESHLAAGQELKTCLKEELDILNNEERLAERENAVLLDEKNETYVKRKHLLEFCVGLLATWLGTLSCDLTVVVGALSKQNKKKN